MRVIARKTVIDFWKKYPDSEQALKAWFAELKNARWKNHHDLKFQFHNASVITNKRIVFNIKGNNYRLIADIEYSLGIVFIVWIGTHESYNKINAKEVKYVKTH